MNAKDRPVDNPMLGTELIDGLTAALPMWLEGRRWFADKGRGIDSVSLEDSIVERVEGDVLLLTVWRVTFQEGQDAQYLVPLAWTTAPGVAEAIAGATIGALRGAVVEATASPWFGRWLIEAMFEATGHGDRWQFTTNAAASDVLTCARETLATVMRAEQSNTSLRFDDVAMLKLVRRLQPGPNPEEEMLRALADVEFDHVPPFLGGASWRASDGESYPIVLAQAYVPNQGDGWSWMLQRLRLRVHAGNADAVRRGSPEWLLGRRTGEMHVALARLSEPEFAPEPVIAASIEASVRRVEYAADQTASVATEAGSALTDRVHALLPSIISGLREATSRAEWFWAEAETHRIRVHGDFHLGQTLRTPDQDWVIIDFEGEPARPVQERREKSSALKDVAGMLRSFAYARGMAERTEPAHQAAFATWEKEARRTFLDGYREAVSEASVALVPADDDEFMAALAAWELDKALYEVAYEIRNRPDWVALPLRSLLPGLAI